MSGTPEKLMGVWVVGSVMDAESLIDSDGEGGAGLVFFEFQSFTCSVHVWSFAEAFSRQLPKPYTPKP